MYYPSKISQLLSKRDAELNTIDELSIYYKELYSTLSIQAIQQASMLKPMYSRIEVNKLLTKNMNFYRPKKVNL